MSSLVVDHRYDDGFCIGWYEPEDGDINLRLGETWSTNQHGKRPVDPEMAEVFDAEHAVAKLSTERRDGAFVFETNATAKAALALAKAAIKAGRANRVIPAWERTALKNGWKPPKGWTGEKGK